MIWNIFFSLIINHIIYNTNIYIPTYDHNTKMAYMHNFTYLLYWFKIGRDFSHKWKRILCFYKFDKTHLLWPLKSDFLQFVCVLQIVKLRGFCRCSNCLYKIIDICKCAKLKWARQQHNNKLPIKWPVPRNIPQFHRSSIKLLFIAVWKFWLRHLFHNRFNID